MILTVALFGSQTDDHFSVFKDIMLPGKFAPPHYLTREDEHWYVLEGKVKMTRGDEVVHSEKGTLLHLSKNVLVHSVVIEQDTPGRSMITYAPAGLEEWFVELGEPAKEGETPFTPHPPPTPEYMAHALHIAETKFGVHFLPPPGARC